MTAENEAKASAEQPTAAAPVGGRIEVSNEEVRDRRRPLTGGELASEEFPDSWAMFGTDMRMKTGGYLKTHLLYDVDGAADKYQLLMSTIPV